MNIGHFKELSTINELNSQVIRIYDTTKLRHFNWVEEKHDIETI